MGPNAFWTAFSAVVGVLNALEKYSPCWQTGASLEYAAPVTQGEVMTSCSG